MRVTVTGSEGTLGRPLCAALRAAGHEVYGIDLQHTGTPNTTRADVADRAQCHQVLNDQSPDLVFHLAAEFGRLNGEMYREQLWRTNAIGFANVLDWAGSWPLDLRAPVILASSSEVYGAVPNEVLYESTAPLHPLNDYAISKLANEHQAWNARRRGQRVGVLRFFNAYGPGETYHPYRSVVCLFCARALMGQAWQVYEGYSRAFMYVGDFMPTLVNAVEQFDALAEVGPVNIGGDDFRSVEELSDIVVAATGCDPALARRLGAEAHNVVTKRPHCATAKSLLGHRAPTRLEEGVPATLAWMDQHDPGVRAARVLAATP